MAPERPGLSFSSQALASNCSYSEASEYEQLLAKAWELKDKPGLSGAIYTQLTDVESEGNGYVTYDREVIKMDIDRVKAANTGKPPVQP